VSVPVSPRRAVSMATMSIFFIVIIASKARFASPPPVSPEPLLLTGVVVNGAQADQLCARTPGPTLTRSCAALSTYEFPGQP